MDLEKGVAVDTEATGVDPWHGDQPFAVSMCDVNGNVVYFEWAVDPFTRDVIPDEEELEYVRSILENPDIPKIMHNAKFDIRMLENGLGVGFKGELHETMFMAHTVNCLECTFALKPLSKKYLGIDDGDQKDLLKKVNSCRRQGKKLGYKIHESNKADYWLPRHFDPENRLCEKYAVTDAARTMGLWLAYSQGLTELDNWDAYRREMALWPVTYQMETRGVRVDLDIIEEEIVSHRKQEVEALYALRKIAGKPDFNPNSDNELIAVLKQLKIVIRHYTPTGQIAVNFKALEDYADVPFVKWLLRYRAAEKANSSFFERYKRLSVREGSGEFALHPNFNQVGPVTARFSCRDPNLQNVPNALTTRSSEPIQARRPFGPRKGYFMYCNDYEQLEVRIFADVAQEPTMLEAILNGRDMHTECTNKAWGGKGNPAAIHSAIQALELAEREPTSALVAEAWKEFWPVEKRSIRNRSEAADRWLACFDYDIVRYIKSLTMEAKRNGYIRNCYNRRVNVDPDKAYRSVNYKVQGSAAELMKTAMRKCNEYLWSTGLDAHLIMTIHDELVFEIKQEHAYKRVLRQLKVIMEDHEGVFGIAMPTEMSRVRDSWVNKEKVEL